MSAARVPAPVQACIGLGGNLGDAVATLRAAIAALDTLPHTRLLRASQLYRSPAWGNQAQPDFINAAAVLSTALPAPELLQALLALEARHGRQRTPGERWGPRTLDLDLLLYAEAVIDLPGLQVPHPYLHQRGFALLPLAEIAAEATIPGHGTVRDVSDRSETDGIVAMGR
ncbi:2-amino-4-hydroxy-6-hydroxymethyldihydropteridine diphosphokinase [Xanthomonas translucens pv. arrhenatheri]|uniref:2-amino-4-hydroxy-6-hydroxymethyldihydropteridine pyrophosphokinase n=1 Tax=Xanthomonas graminis pv. arrhenatheri LMG 727 TaxID=1195923 RepID=A0A0K2ZE66_9XANT|nr:2-amino-4-hydroxy-6-hydroxymethyldihydropteridine diphosphokinase [Xanthomonas translucens]OAX66714.1 2-amino-4-hydroxy-6-hydroxymethyldihydropteridine diphosphokinase [Xanthomonas translucens pv. arrhenatheri]UKE79213.1 2-amino-4-hydroxy-6-hydroxymethyldihydropteridine diphosphokinase [Xanthomonas translucens pv. arrhenatheri]CTP82424.1 2-amino-4-hydroxy-6-hydroxymethyldihydropteridinepyrophosphokinase [Xanthomonas translucens pv. arrhenatheri LMG 727]